MKGKLLILSLVLLVGQFGIAAAAQTSTNMDLQVEWKAGNQTNNYQTFKPTYQDIERVSFEREVIQIEHDRSLRSSRISAEELITAFSEVDETFSTNAKPTGPKDQNSLFIDEEKDIRKFPGKGTADNPYVISNKNFLDRNNDSNLLTIINLDVHILIEANLFEDAESLFAGIVLNNVQNVVIQNNNFSSNTFGIFIENSANIVITGNNIVGSVYDGLLIRSSSFVTVDGNVISSNGLSGIYLDASHNNEIQANSIGNNGGDGIFVQDSNDNWIMENTIFDNGLGTTAISPQGFTVSSGLFIDPSFNNNVINNTITGNEGDGILLELSDNNVIVGNTVAENGLNGIFLKDSSYNSIAQNAVTNNGNPAVVGLVAAEYGPNAFTSFGSGIFVDPSYGNVIDGNEVASNAGSGVYLQLSDGNTISNNNVHTNDYDGIFLEDSDNNGIRGNTVFANGQDTSAALVAAGFAPNAFTSFGSGIFVDPSSGNVIENNNVYDNAANGVLLELSDSNQVISNFVYSNGYDGIFLKDSNANLIALNHIFSNGVAQTTSALGLNAFTSFGSGIFVDPSFDNVLDGNVIYDNAAHGMFLQLSSNNSVVNNDIFSNDYEGVLIDQGGENLFEGNNIAQNALNGLFILDSNYNVIRGNAIEQNGGSSQAAALGLNAFGTSLGSGIFVDPSVGNVIENNNVTSNAENGVFVFDSNSTIISANNLVGNGIHGLELNSNSATNQATENNFKANNQGSFQARDDGLNNQFANNYYDNVNNVDENYDGIVDEPVLIDGDAGNVDAVASNIPTGKNIVDFGFIAEIVPDTLNADSEGTPVTAKIELQDGYRVLSLDTTKLWLNDTVQADSFHVIDILRFTVTFDRLQVNNLINGLALERGLTAPFEVVLEVSGEMNDGLLLFTAYGTTTVNQTGTYNPLLVLAPVGLLPLTSKKNKKKFKDLFVNA